MTAVTLSRPRPIMPNSCAAANERSSTRPLMNGPRSLTTTTTLRRDLASVTRRRVPNGMVRWAAVNFSDHSVRRVPSAPNSWCRRKMRSRKLLRAFGDSFRTRHSRRLSVRRLSTFQTSSVLASRRLQCSSLLAQFRAAMVYYEAFRVGVLAEFAQPAAGDCYGGMVTCAPRCGAASSRSAHARPRAAPEALRR